MNRLLHAFPDHFKEVPEEPIVKVARTNQVLPVDSRGNPL